MSRRFWGAGATPRGPTLAFLANAADRTKTLGAVRAAVVAEAIHVTGGLSAGSLGWSLTGEVARHRWTVTLYVTAFQQSRRKGPAGIQDFDYDARVSGLTSGRYRLRVVHLYVDHLGEPLGEPVTVLEQPLLVGRGAMNSLLPALCWLGLWSTTLGG
jgi:hypothetical protein